MDQRRDPVMENSPAPTKKKRPPRNPHLVSHVQIIERVASQLRISPTKVERVLGTMIEEIILHLRFGAVVHIDDFATFGPIEKQPHDPRKRWVGDEPTRVKQVFMWRAHLPLIKRINATEPIVRKAKPTKEALIPPALVDQVRLEDEQLVATWLAEYRSHALLSSHEALYGPITHPALSDATIRAFRGQLYRFSRWLDTPLARLGETEVNGTKIISVQEAMLKVSSFAALYRVFAERRLQKAYPELAHNKAWGSPVWRTQTWRTFVQVARRFYAWLEIKGYRPPGSNPFVKELIRTYSPLPRVSKPLMLASFDQLLAYPGMTRAERAVIMLLGNGLRPIEVSRARLEHLNLPENGLTVLGKGTRTSPEPIPKVRLVPLLPWTISAMNVWLHHRRDDTSPNLFHTRTGRPLTPDRVRFLFHRVIARVFPNEDQQAIREEMTPRQLRRYFVTRAIKKGIQLDALMKATGHASYTSLQPYIALGPADVKEEFGRITKEKWF